MEFLALGDEDNLVATAIVNSAKEFWDKRLAEILEIVIPALSNSIGVAVNNAVVKAFGG